MGDRHGDSIRSARKARPLQTAELITPLRVVGIAFCALGDPGHGPHHIDGIGSDRGLARQHQCIRAIEHGVGDVTDFGAGRRRGRDHALHHLRRGDDRHSGADAGPHNAFLHVRHVFEGALDPQIPPCNHHRVGDRDDLVEVLDRRQRFDLGHQADPARSDRGAHLVEIVGAANERHREEVHAFCGHGIGQYEVFRSGRLDAQPLGREVHAGTSLSVPTAAHLALGAAGRHTVDPQCDRAITDDDPVADVEVAQQRVVVDADHDVGARVGIGHHRDQRPCSQLDPGGGERGRTHLGTRKVGEHGDDGSGPGSSLADGAEPGDVLVEMAVAEIEAHDIDPCEEHRIEDLGRVTGGAQRGHDLRSRVHA